jgi:hypothetical protein
MNIFCTSNDPLHCAEALDDKRLVKMILESAQILCTIVGGKYKPTHTNHPCTVWAKSSSSNALWLYAHALYMCQEYSKRFAKLHASQEVIEETFKRLYSLPDTRPAKGDGAYFPQSWVNVSGIEGNIDTFAAYRVCLNNKWDADTRTPVWTNKKPPTWARWRHTVEVVSTNPNDVICKRYHYAQKNRLVKFP